MLVSRIIFVEIIPLPPSPRFCGPYAYVNTYIFRISVINWGWLWGPLPLSIRHNLNVFLPAHFLQYSAYIRNIVSRKITAHKLWVATVCHSWCTGEKSETVTHRSATAKYSNQTFLRSLRTTCQTVWSVYLTGDVQTRGSITEILKRKMIDKKKVELYQTGRFIIFFSLILQLITYEFTNNWRKRTKDLK